MGLAYWEQFTRTGKIEDYLRYRNENLQKAEEGKRESVGNSNRDRAVSDAHRGVR